MKISRIFLLIVVFAGGVSVAYGCECGGSHKEQLRDAKQIFLGQVISIGESKTFNTKITGFPIHSVTFKVEKRWKGGNVKEVSVLTDSPAGMCGRVTFRQGEEYLVYVYEDSFLPANCSWSGDLNAPWVPGQIKELNSFWFRLKARLHW